MVHSVGHYIKNLREQSGLTQSQVARRVGWRSSQFLSNIERDEAHLPPDKVRPMAKALGVSASRLVRVHLMAYSQDYKKQVNKRK